MSTQGLALLLLQNYLIFFIYHFHEQNQSTGLQVLHTSKNISQNINCFLIQITFVMNDAAPTLLPQALARCNPRR
jgi:hypothetical protein